MVAMIELIKVVIWKPLLLDIVRHHLAINSVLQGLKCYYNYWLQGLCIYMHFSKNHILIVLSVHKGSCNCNMQACHGPHYWISS